MEGTRLATAYVILGVGVLATLLTLFAQLRFLVQGLTSRSQVDVRRGAVAGSVGMASIIGGVLAMAGGGPGAIVWMWIATGLAMAVTYLEVELALRYRRARGDGGAMAQLGGFGRMLVVPYSLGLVMFALFVAALQTQQASAILSHLSDISPVTASLLLAALGAPMILVPTLGRRAGVTPGRDRLLLLAPAAVILYVIGVAAVISHGEALTPIEGLQTMTAAFGDDLKATAAGLVGGALPYGVMRVVVATEGGIGSAALREDLDGVPDTPASRGSAAAAAMTGPLVGGIVISTLTALALLTNGQDQRLRVDDLRLEVETEEGGEPVVREHPRFVSLERPHSRGTKGSLERGQTIVLPVDTPLEADKRYPMVFRSNPRGHQIGQISPEKNAILLADQAIAQNVDTVVFRDPHETRRLDPAYDRRVRVENEIVTAPNGATVVVLTPVDPTIEFRKMRTKMMGPFVVLDDFHFWGTVSKAYSPDPKLEHHLAMIEQREEGDPPNPVLRTFLDMGYRGPYFDDGEPRPPMAMVAEESFHAELGERKKMRFETPPRGLPLGYVKGGELRVPAWRFLADTQYALIRHKEDPAKDLRVKVDQRVEGGMLRFKSAQPEIVDFRKADVMRAYTGPYLLAPPYEFEVEVHSGIRIPDPPGTPFDERGLARGTLADRLTLVPIHAQPEPTGGHGELYDPHPAEVALSSMEGPFLVETGGTQIARAFAPLGFGAAFALGASVWILAITCLVSWATVGARAADQALGRGGGFGFRVAFLIAAAIGGAVALEPLVATLDFLVLPLVVMNGLVVLILARRT